MIPKLIGFCGGKGCGKDTAAAFFIKECNLVDFKRIAFADALKQEVADGLGVPVQFIEDYKPVFRTILQQWGTEIRRNLFGQDYWVVRLHDKACSEIWRRGNGAIITDVRFPNEAKYIHDNGGLLVRVTGREVTVDAHESEANYKKFNVDYELDNSKTVAHLHEEVRNLCRILWNPKIYAP